MRRMQSQLSSEFWSLRCSLVFPAVQFMGGSQSSEHCDPNAKGSKIKCLVNSVSSQRSQVACSSPRRHWPVVVAMGVVTVATAAATTEGTAEVTTEATR